MTQNFDRMERQIERDLHVLRGLPEAECSPALMARLRMRVLTESQRVRRPWRWRYWSALASAAVMLTALGLSAYGPGPASEADDPLATLDAWSAAIDASGSLLDDATVLGLGGFYQESEEFEAFFDGLDRSFEMLDGGT